ncbi:RHS repeat-associated core domain-containing protein [Desulfobulbus rhabdoformis]|uniref:RHS repeat-associated core domain-containing protein n=1 Tax=Desulfobulbus rhabdoformis TaxID=34032 RepID=UPI0030845D87
MLRDLGEGEEPVSGLRCYLYSMDEGEGLNATDLYADSDDQGMVHFLVPEELPYYAVTTLLGQEFISQEFEGEGILIIELGRMIVTVRDFDLATETDPDGLVQGAVVTLCTTDGIPMRQELITGADGQVRFTLPEGHYHLQITYDDQQFWSGDISIYPFWDTPVEIIDGYGGMLSRLHDPHPPLWHGTQPQYRPMLALLSGSLAGMLNTSATPVADAPQVFYYLNDHLGTAQLLVNEAGTVIWKGETQPFGQVTEAINQIGHRFRFPGQMVDPESGLHYNWHRFYDPETGRYISADPIGLGGGMNLYSYVVQNPINWSDRLGLAPGDKFGTVDAAAIDAIDYSMPKSEKADREYGGYVYGTPDGMYSYAAPVEGDKSGMNTDDFNCISEDTSKEGIYHTHPGDGRMSPYFSPFDTITSGIQGVPIYLGTNKGIIKKHTPGVGDKTLRY